MAYNGLYAIKPNLTKPNKIQTKPNQTKPNKYKTKQKPNQTKPKLLAINETL